MGALLFPILAPFPEPVGIPVGEDGQCQGLGVPCVPCSWTLTAMMPTVTLRQPQTTPVAEMMLCSRVISCRLIRRMHRHSWGRQKLLIKWFLETVQPHQKISAINSLAQQVGSKSLNYSSKKDRGNSLYKQGEQINPSNAAVNKDEGCLQKEQALGSLPPSVTSFFVSLPCWSSSPLPLQNHFLNAGSSWKAGEWSLRWAGITLLNSGAHGWVGTPGCN